MVFDPFTTKSAQVEKILHFILQNFEKQTNNKSMLLSNFYMNGRTLRFHPHTKKLEPFCATKPAAPQSQT